MASKRGVKRRERRRACEGKVAHPSLDGALTAKRKSGHDVHAYKCKWCGFWHLGRMSSSMAGAMANRRRDTGPANLLALQK